MTEYKFLPFYFNRINDDILLTNDVGDYHFLSKEDFRSFIDKNLQRNSPLHMDLKAKHFLYDKFLGNIVDLLAARYRTKHKFLYDYTSLHMFVITLRCNQKCLYCHASSKDHNAGSQFDMDIKTAINAVEFAFKGPSPHIKIEFQGGEPLLNFDVVKAIVDHAEKINQEKKKIVEFVLCSNMVNIKKDHLDYFKEKKICISTSLDGPRDIHNKCRILRNGKGSYDHVISNMDWVKSELGPGAVSALMTVTPHNVKRLKEVIDEYLYHELEYIFIRKINPLGYAYKNTEIYYSNDEFIDGYRKALKYLIEINLNGTLFPEAFTTILLSRILTPFSTGFVDLQSPTGAGISGIIYDVNGDIYVSDEARMMYRTTGEKFFCIGNVITSTWKEVYEHPVFREMINQSCTSAIPGCAWCAYQPYCGSDPVRNYFTQKSMIGHRPTNEFCMKHKAIFDTLFEYLKSENEDVEDVFWSWLTNRRVDQIRLHASILPEE